MMFKKFIWFYLIALLILGFVKAQDTLPPVISNPMPENGTFIRGGATYLFSVEVTDENLDTSSVKLHIGSEEVWPDDRAIIDMDCREEASNKWKCVANVTIAVAETGTKEFYFFEASDTEGNKGYLATLEEPYFMIIDREPPNVEPHNFKNDSYIGVVEKLYFKITDNLAGVNASVHKIFWMYKNESFESSWNEMEHEGGNIFYASLDTSDLPLNSSYYVYVNASDVLGNYKVYMFRIIVDNEYPTLIIKSPTTSTLAGSVQLSVEAKDSCSGINPSSIIFKVDGVEDNMLCNYNGINYTCSKTFNTSRLADGEYLLVFYVRDNAGNEVKKEMNVKIDNTKAHITFVQPNSTYFSKTIPIKVTISKNVGINSVEVMLEGVGFKEVHGMECSSDFLTCSYVWDVSSLKEGAYTLKVKVNADVNYPIESEKDLIIDHTPPEINFYSPEDTVKGEFPISVLIRDNNPLDEGLITGYVDSSKVDMGCTVYLMGEKLICGSFYDSTKLNDGNHNITVIARDRAGNEKKIVKTVRVDNNPPSLEFLKIMPLWCKQKCRVFFTVGSLDISGKIKIVSVRARGANYNFSLNLSYNKGVWKNSIIVDKKSGYLVDVYLEDESKNNITEKEVGYFYVGDMPCGNGKCDDVENYCLCPQDCEPIECPSDKVISCISGIPECRERDMCGNYYCGDDEDCETCPEDCGTCLEGEPTKGWDIGIIKVTKKGMNFKDILKYMSVVVAVVFMLFLAFKLRKKLTKRKREWYEYPELP